MIYSVVTPDTHAHVSTAHISLVGRKQNVRVADNIFCDICLSFPFDSLIFIIETSRYNAPREKPGVDKAPRVAKFR